MGNSNAELQMQRGSYLNAMALADQVLSQWFSHRLGVPSDQQETFSRFVETGSLGGRIELFRRLSDSPEHKDVARTLEEANEFRNVLAHGVVAPAPHSESSLPTTDDWVILQSRRKGYVLTPISAASIEAKKSELLDALYTLTQMTAPET